MAEITHDPELAESVKSTESISVAKHPKQTKRPYRVICISMYEDDIAELDAKVASLKARGVTDMSRSRLLRIAMRQIDQLALGIIQASP